MKEETMGKKRSAPIVFDLAFLFACVCFLIGHSIYAARINSVTADEYVHLPAAIAIAQTGDMRLDHPGSPPLRVVAAIPALFMNPVMDYNNEFWKKKRVYQFSWLFMVLNFNRYHELFFGPRMAIALFAVILAALVFVAAGKMFGRVAAAIAVFLVCFSPEVLAHAPLVTVDVLTACFFLPLFIFTSASSTHPGRLMCC